jgi:hypothetical protein
LVIDHEAPPVRVLWNELAVSSVPEAVAELRQREDTKTSWIGRWSTNLYCADAINDWARDRKFEGVVWSAMPPKFHGENYLRPSKAEAIDYLAQLNGEERQNAEDYVRKAPAQIETPYRRAIQETLGWTPLG